MARSCIVAVLVCALAWVAGGCPTSGNGGNNGDGTIYEFTVERQDAVTLVVEQVVAAAGAFATLSSLTDDRIDLTSFGTFGTCPQVSFASAGGSSAIVRLDYDNGCSAAATGTATIAGAVDAYAVIGQGWTQVQYGDITIDDREITGLLNSPGGSESEDGARLDGTCTIETEDVGEFVGDITVDLLAAGGLELSTESVRVSRGTTSYNLELETLRVQPATYDNFVPISGRLTFTGPGLIDILVVFTERSAEDGIVQVTVGNGSAVNFEAIDVGS